MIDLAVMCDDIRALNRTFAHLPLRWKVYTLYKWATAWVIFLGVIHSVIVEVPREAVAKWHEFFTCRAYVTFPER